MHFMLKTACLALTLGLCVSTAAVVDFESSGLPANDAFLFFTTQGFVFDSTDNLFFIKDPSVCAIGGCVAPGSYIADYAYAPGLVMRKAGGGSFRLNSLQSSQLWLDDASALFNNLVNGDT